MQHVYHVFLWRRANARNVRLCYPYTNHFIFRFVSQRCCIDLYLILRLFNYENPVFSQDFKVGPRSVPLPPKILKFLTLGDAFYCILKLRIVDIMQRRLHEVFTARNRCPKIEPTRLDVWHFDSMMFIILCDCFCWTRAKFLCLCGLLTSLL